MVETIKAKLGKLLKEKEISLAMLYDAEGRILWHTGREIKGRSVDKGVGFCKSVIRKSLKSGREIENEDVIMTCSSGDVLSGSAQRLLLKSIVILPVDNDFFLYIDSGTKESFNHTERELFRMLGEFLKETIHRIREDEYDVGGISGNSQEIIRIRKLVLKYSLEEEPVLLLGETGTGKNHIAQLIHKYSGRKGKLVVAHVPTIPENLFESFLFGHRRGAFTDAKSDQRGLVAEAAGGTLFIDEIAEVPLSFQAKLLRFIDTKRFQVLGESVERSTDVRIIAATNRKMHEAIARKEFREDLYYRLNVLEVEIPPLRRRKEDIKALVRENQKFLKGKRPTDGFWDMVLNYDWPGNIRELITVLKRAGIFLDSPVIGKEIENIIYQGHAGDSIDPEGEEDEIRQIWNDIKGGKNFWETVKNPYLNRDISRKEVRKIVEKALSLRKGRYCDILDILNLETEEYKKLMNFLKVHKIMKE